ncbi:hypothetical protein RRF57_006242 [Xylaria bambusicola]|uniref:Uncharacterized protein n=1 Tax=Xylaria bambusicola TaxID=326684 RepID=A0AAN7Z5F0_9PEZI
MFYNISLMVYRDNANGVHEILVRYDASQAQREYCLPSHSLEPGEQPIPSAQRLGSRSLGINIPDSALSLKGSVTMETTGRQPKEVRIFVVRSTAEFEALTQRDEVRGWKHTFIPYSAVRDLWVTPGIAVPRVGVVATLDRALELLEQ